jgi:hypothetical protein
MKRTFIVLLGILVAFLILPLFIGGLLKIIDPFPSEYSITPGQRVGSITVHTTEQELKKLFPADDVHRILYHDRNGDVYCATEIYADGSDSITLAWKRIGYVEPYYDGSDSEEYEADAKKRCYALPMMHRPIFVSLGNRFANWHINGIKLAGNIGQLEKANGTPFSFSACECDSRGGEALNWNNGALSSLIVKLEFPYNYHETSLGNFLDPYAAVPNDILSSSDVPAEFRSQIGVKEIIVYFDHPKNNGEKNHDQ